MKYLKCKEIKLLNCCFGWR